MSVELVPVYRARSFVDAQLVRGLLASEGLHPVLPGEGLNDELGVTSRAVGTSATTVLVPREELENAREIVAAWRESGGQ